MKQGCLFTETHIVGGGEDDRRSDQDPNAERDHGLDEWQDEAEDDG